MSIHRVEIYARASTYRRRFFSFFIFHVKAPRLIKNTYSEYARCFYFEKIKIDKNR